MTVGVSAPLKPNKKQAGLKERPASCAPGASETPVATHTGGLVERLISRIHLI